MPTTDLSRSECDLRAKMAAARAFVEAFAEVETYGGGVRAYLWLGGRFIDAYDGWKGRENALDRLAERLIRQVRVEDSLPCSFADLRAVAPPRQRLGDRDIQDGARVQEFHKFPEEHDG